MSKRREELFPLPDDEMVEFYCVEHGCFYRLHAEGALYRGMLAEGLTMLPRVGLPKIIRTARSVEVV